ncbi:MAG: short chain dehydrogenase [Chitinophagaceae bacterium]|nr:MAG: short chain dehydrogenase [Chitinophagaceae bacterium]
MKIVLVGATGTIGAPVAALLRENGHDVVEATRKSNPSLDITDAASVEAFFKATGEVDAVVCVAGDAAFAPLEALTDDQVQLCSDSKLMGQVNLVRRALPYLRPGGSFVLTGGILAYTPWPATSMIALVNSGVEGFVRGASLDLKDGRRAAVVHPPFVAETARALGMDATPWPPAAKAAEAYLQALTDSKNGAVYFVEGYAPQA